LSERDFVVRLGVPYQDVRRPDDDVIERLLFQQAPARTRIRDELARRLAHLGCRWIFFAHRAPGI
jgi:hypothetical protein